MLLNETYSFLPWIVSTEKMSCVGEFSATIWICYNLQIQKRIVSAETICGNTVMENEMNVLIHVGLE